MIRVFKRLFAAAPASRAAHRLYAQAVAQARREGFYRDLGVPDTLDGRFDMVVLHVFLLLARLRDPADRHRRLQTRLQEVLFADMDRALREMGVGDLSVGKQVKKMASAYFGRIAAYDAALQQDAAPDALPAALARNVWRGSPPSKDAVARLANYMHRQRVHLEGQESAALAAGQVDFAPIDEQEPS